MGLITEKVKIKPSGQIISYYKNLGYNFENGEEIEVKVSDLSKGSHVVIYCKCDYCDKDVYLEYHTYLRSCNCIVPKIACEECRTKKSVECNIIKYGVKSCASRKDVQEKISETCLKKYGVDNYSKTEDYKLRMKTMSQERYGTDYIFQSDEIKAKIINTNLKKYGKPSTLWVPEVRDKINESMLNKYGVINPMQNLELVHKAKETLTHNQSVATSIQQKYICALYYMDLNYPVLYWNVDMFDKENNYIVEYDGGGHDLSVKLGNITKENFTQREIMRNNTLKRAGYKMMRIISPHDKLPSDDTLLQMLSDAKQYFKDYPEHSWINFDIDNNTVKNAEYERSYFYGNLRKITKNDLVSA